MGSSPTPEGVAPHSLLLPVHGSRRLISTMRRLVLEDLAAEAPPGGIATIQIAFTFPSVPTVSTEHCRMQGSSGIRRVLLTQSIITSPSMGEPASQSGHVSSSSESMHNRPARTQPGERDALSDQNSHVGIDVVLEGIGKVPNTMMEMASCRRRALFLWVG